MSRSMRKKIVFLPYDFDTAIGINNEGSLVFSYNLEDTDTVDDAEVFNGQDSVLWNNLRRAFARELRSMYRDLRSDGIISYDTVERMFEEHQGKWTASIFNEDSWYKYIDPLRHDGDDSYLSMMQGSKAEQRKWWLNNRFRYIDSKYNAGDALTDVITLRGYAKANITVTPYADIYPTIKYGSYLVSERGSRGNPTTLVCPLDRVNDTEIYIYSASQIASAGDLSGLKVGYANFSMATRLQSLKLGDADPEYSNRNLKTLYLGNNTLLRSIDVRNCAALGTDKQKAIDLSGCSNIEHVYFDNTAVSSVALPNGGILKTLHLPSTVSDLTILNQRGITDFTLPSTENLTSLRLENVSSVIDSLSILRSLPARSSVRLIGFDWSCSSYAEILGVLDLLDSMKGIDERGETVGSAQIYGTIHVPAINTDQIRAIQARYHDITIAPTVISYRVRFYNGETLLHTAFVESGTDATDPVIAGTIETPYKESEGRTGYAYAGWDIPLTNITADSVFSAVFTETHAYEVKFQNYDGTPLYSTLVAEGATCPDPVKNNIIVAPTRPADTNYFYSYLGWDGSLVNVRQDRVLTAVFSSQRSYAIIYKNPSPDNTILFTEYLPYMGIISDPVADGRISTPTYPTNTSSQIEYTFQKWDTTPSGTATSNRTYTAQYQQTNYYIIIFQDEDGTELLREKWLYGQTITEPVAAGRLEEPTKAPSGDILYTFWRWQSYDFPRTATQNITTKAQYKTDQVWTVRFVNWDNTLLDTQQVPDAGYAEEPIAAGRIGTPLRSSTEAYDYTYSRWNYSMGPIRNDTTITAQFTSTTRSYRVNFFDGETLLLSQMLLYGRRYSYPERLTDGNRFVTHWMPKQFYSYTDIDLHAQWTDLLTDSWNEIIASAEDGTYKTKYSVGQYKMLDFGKYGIVPMRLTAFDTKQTPEGDTAKMLWCAYEPINTPIPFATNFPDVSLHYTFTQVVNATDGYRFNQSSSDYYQHISTSQFTITADEATDIRITSYTGLSSYAGFMLVYVNGEYFYAQNSADGDVTKTVHIGAGESITVTVINSAENQGTQNYGKLSSIIFNADVPLTITKAAEDPAWHHPYAEGNVYTYAESDLRGFLENSVYPELPAELKAAIKTVVNQQSAYSLAENKMFAQETQDRLWVPNVNELFNSNNHTYDGSSRLGAGMFTAINGFGMENVINTRTVSSRESAYKAGNNDPQSVSHGGQTARFNMPGKVFPCFAL